MTSGEDPEAHCRGKVAAAARGSRLAVFTVVCVVLAASGHAMAAGGRPPVPALVLGCGLVAAVAARLTGRERSAAEITVALLATQAGLHLLFTTAAASTTATSAAVIPDGMSAGSGMAGSGMAMPAGSPMPYGWMWAAHVAAGVGAAWWLRRGEAAVWALCCWWAARAMRWLPAPAPLPAAVRLPAVVVWAPLARPATAVLRHCVARRGPPRDLGFSTSFR